MTRKMTIGVVDDHVLFREGICFLLSKWNVIQNVVQANDGAELLSIIKNNVPDVILMDIEMPNMNGIEATKICAELYPETKIIALSMYANECFYKDMLDVGAKGFLLKNSRFETVQKAILEVMQGNSYFSPEILEGIIKNLNTPEKSNKQNDLSDREIEVLLNICKGLSNQEIANKLYISKRTVDKHRENILLKTQSKNTAELVVYAIKNEYFLP